MFQILYSKHAQQYSKQCHTCTHHICYVLCHLRERERERERKEAALGIVKISKEIICKFMYIQLISWI